MTPQQADRVYLGWEYAVLHPHPGPPPRRPVPPGQERLDPGWVAAQQREERRLSLPLKAGAAASAGLAALSGALGAASVLTPALATTEVVACLAVTVWCARGVWRGARELRDQVAAEDQRVARAQAAQERRLAAWQEEHAQRFRDWEARGRVFETQRQWYGVTLPTGIDRVDVAGGTLAGWSALMALLAGLRLAAGGQVTVLDLSEGAVAQDLLALAADAGVDPLVWVLPGDLPRLDLGTGLTGEALADVLAVAAATAADPASPPDPVPDRAILERIARVLGDQPSIGQLTAGLRSLAQIGDPRDDIRRGQISAAQAEAIAGLYGRAASGQVITERALGLEARLRTLETLGSAPATLPPSPLRVVALDRAADVTHTQVLGAYVTAALTHLLRRQPRGPAWQHTLLVAGGEKLRGDLLDRLSDACEASGTGLVLTYRSLPAHIRERLGRGNAAVAFMRLGNADDARAASEQIGTEHRFVVSQLTDTVGDSVSDTGSYSYTSTVGTADSVAVSASESQGRGHGRGHGQSWSGLGAFAPRTASGHQESNWSEGTSESRSWTASSNASTAWGLQTARAVAASTSVARTSQRSREFLVEQHELQQLPPSAMIVSYASAAGRRVVFADANPGILTLPTATLASLDEARSGAPAAGWPAAGWPGAGPPVGRPAAAGSPAAGEPAGGSPVADPWPAPSPRPADLGRPARPARPSRPARPPRPAPTAGTARTAHPADPAAAPWPGPVPPPARDPAEAPLSWRDDGPPPNLGPPPEPLDWRREP
jgi:hypothetical protein